MHVYGGQLLNVVEQRSLIYFQSDTSGKEHVEYCSSSVWVELHSRESVGSVLCSGSVWMELHSRESVGSVLCSGSVWMELHSRESVAC